MSGAGQASANPARGEAVLALGPARLVVRPTFAALVAAEAELGSLFALIEAAATGTLRVEQLVRLIWHCLAEPGEWTVETLGEAVLREGLAAAMPVVRQLLAAVLQGR